MNGELRRVKILEYLTEHELLTGEEAAVRFDTSPATIRRDFALLDSLHRVQRFHGGIRAVSKPDDRVVSFALRSQWFSEEKRRLAEYAASLIPGGSTVFIDGGTTTVHLGMFLPSDVTVITNSLPLCNEIRGHWPEGAGPNIILPGGRLTSRDLLLLGPDAEEGVRRYHADIALFSVRAADGDSFYNNNEEVAGIERAMAACSDRSIVLIDHSKIGKTALCRLGDVSMAERLVTTPCREHARILAAIQKKGVKIDIVPEKQR